MRPTYMLPHIAWSRYNGSVMQLHSMRSHGGTGRLDYLGSAREEDTVLGISYYLSIYTHFVTFGPQTARRVAVPNVISCSVALLRNRVVRD